MKLNHFKSKEDNFLMSIEDLRALRLREHKIENNRKSRKYILEKNQRYRKMTEKKNKNFLKNLYPFKKAA